MKKKERKILSYYVYFHIIKNAKGKTIGRIKNQSILIDDDEFIRLIQPIPNLKLEHKPVRYTIIDQRSNQVLGSSDQYYNLFTIDHQYFGSLYHATKALLFVIRCALLALLTLLIMFIVLQKTQNNSRPTDLIVSETDGGIVTTQWNIFGKNSFDRIIYPGKRAIYTFMLTNNNPKAVSIDILFKEQNKNEIPMVYRLKVDGSYLQEDQNDWLSINQLYAQDIVIPAQSSIVCELEWWWQENQDDEQKDTSMAISGLATYTIYVEVTSELIYPNQSKGGNYGHI